VQQIHPLPLWIGGRGDIRDVSVVLALGIEAVVDLADSESPLTMPRDVAYFRVPLNDGSGNPVWRMHSAINIAEQLLRDKVPMLICCQSGMSRSRAIAAVAFSRVTGRPTPECLVLCGSSGPTDVSPAFWNELLEVARGTTPGGAATPVG
jgi:hypothetical protein